MAGKKPEKSKPKAVAKDKNPTKDKRIDAKVKDKIVLKKSDKAAPNRLSAIEKAKSKVKQAIEKVTGKATKPAKESPALRAKTAKVEAKPHKISGKTEKIEKPGKLAKPAKDEKTVKLPVEKLAKGLKPTDKKSKEEAVAPPAPALRKAPSKGQLQKSELSKKSAAAKDKNKCREPGCDLDIILSGYCRLHYIKNWRRIKKKESIMSTGQLDGYVEELVAKYPDKYLDAVENDLASEKEWTKVITDLELGASEDDFVAEDEDSPISEATGRRSSGAAFDDEDEDVY